MRKNSPASSCWARSMVVTVLLLALGLAGTQAANFPLRWRWSNPAPHGNNIADMAYSAPLGLAVQVCERGQIFTSRDLLYWTPQDSGTSNALRGAAFMGTRILVTGENGTVLYADIEDAFQFGTLTNGATGDWLEGVAASSAVAVAVGDAGAVYTSPNGIQWRRQTTTITNWLRGVAFGGTFVAVGEFGYIGTSTAGTVWTKRTSGTTRHLNRVAFANNRFTAVGDNGVVLQSLDAGVTRTSATSGATNHLLTISDAVSARLVAGEAEARVQLNTTWTNELAKSNGPPSWTYLSAVGRSDFFVLGGRSGLIAEGYRTNQSGYFWILSDDSIRPLLFEATYAPNFYVSVGDRASVLTSRNGVDWSLELVPPAVTNSTFLGVGGNTNLLIAVGDKGSLILSANRETNYLVTNIVGGTTIISNKTVNTLGIVWQALEPRPTTNDLQGVCAAPGLYLVTGNNGTILTSPDGTNWTPRASSTNVMLSAVAWHPGGYVASGAKGTILSSPDSVTWTPRTSGTTNWIYRVRYVGGRLVAVGQNGTILTSFNGTTWTAQTSGTTRWLNDVTFVDGLWFAVGASGAVLSSSNAVTWTDRGTITQKALYSAATDSRQLIAVGVEGAILRTAVIPDRTPVNILQYSRTLSGVPPMAENLYFFTGKADQRFTLDYRLGLGTNTWNTGPQLEFYDSSGTLFYLETITSTNFSKQEFYRTTLKE